jgi:hypothetical protein
MCGSWCWSCATKMFRIVAPGCRADTIQRPRPVELWFRQRQGTRQPSARHLHLRSQRPGGPDGPPHESESQRRPLGGCSTGRPPHPLQDCCVPGPQLQDQLKSEVAQDNTGRSYRHCLVLNIHEARYEFERFRNVDYMHVHLLLLHLLVFVKCICNILAH